MSAPPRPPPLGARLALAWPLVVPAALLGVVTDEGKPIAGLLVVACLACAVAGGRVTLDRASQRVLVLVGGGVAFALHRAFSGAPIAGELHPSWVSVARAALALGAIRLLLTEADGGYAGTVVLGAVAMLACGEVRLGAGYIVSVAAFVALAIWAMRVADGARADLRAIPRRARVVAVSMPILAATLAFAVAAPMRPISKYLQRKMERYYEAHFLGGKVGFSDQLRMGRMTKLLESDEVALRIRGSRVGKSDLLRGAIFDHYDHGNWTFTRMAPAVSIAVGKGRQRGADVLEVRRGGADSDRLFLPALARGLSTPSGAVRVDGGGVARRASTSDSVYWFSIGARDALAVQEPTPEDSVVPEEARARLAGLARAWTDGAAGHDALARIEERLRSDFVYSLTSDHSKAHDPVMSFLFRHHDGHCEYFASSMALLARSLGIPARVVAGYRVSERNPYLDTYVVRERDAHAWVEAFVPGVGWRSYDPTPIVEGAGAREGGRWSDAIEVLAYGWDAAEAWLADRSLVQLIGAAVAGAALFVFLRVRRNRVARGEAPTPTGYAPPLAAFERLAAALAARGHVRGASESLEAYAQRIADAELAALVRRYAELRYGDVADVSLESDLDAASLRVKRG